MLLGNRGSRWRCLIVWSMATTSAALAAGWSTAVAHPAWSAVRTGQLDALPLDRALTGLAATALLGCAVWAWVVTTVTVLEARRGVRAFDAGQWWRAPSGVRRVVLAACGVALVGAVGSPAMAGEAGHVRHGLAGLPLPDRATAPHQHRPPNAPLSSAPAPHSVVVAPGDSLWSIAAAELPPGASAARITERWHAVYAANRPVIGSDPDRLAPGQQLLLPGKESS
jgi:nucleoid-associated protein YgaU